MSATTARERLHDALAAAGSKITNGGNAATCPAHEDHAPSLSIGQRRDGDGVLMQCHAGCQTDDVLAVLGLAPADLFDNPREPGTRPEGRPRTVATYPYTDEQGTLLYEKVRLEPKTFRQRRPEGTGWAWSLGDVRRVLYALPDVLAAVAAGEPVYVAEGEKDADALARAGVTATTWTEGAWKPDQRPKWRPAYTETLRGAHVVIVRDRDETGRHTAATIAALLEPVAASVAVVEPTQGKDAADHLAAGLTVGDLVAVEHHDDEPSEADPVDDAAPGASWEPVDLADTVAGLLAGTLTRHAPTIGARDDGACLFYAGKVNGIAGASGSGKTWTALAACAQQIATGEHVMYVDLEDDAVGIVGRLLDLGADPAHLAGPGRRFHYLHPQEAFGIVAAELVRAVLARHRPSLVVIDSTGESMALEGAKPNDDDDTARWFRKLPTAIAHTGPAVLVLDHVVKADEGGLWPIGSQRKRAAVSGAQYMQTTVRPFDKGTAGMAKLVCAKDRHGNYRPGQKVAELHVTPDDVAGVMLTLRPPSGDVRAPDMFRPTALMERASKALEAAAEPLSGRAINELVPGKRDAVAQAVEVLVVEGYVERSEGERRAKLHTSLRPYRQSSDPRSDAYEPDRTSVPVSASPPIEGGGGRTHSLVPGTHSGRTGTHWEKGSLTSANTGTHSEHSAPDDKSSASPVRPAPQDTHDGPESDHREAAPRPDACPACGTPLQDDGACLRCTFEGVAS